MLSDDAGLTHYSIQRSASRIDSTPFQHESNTLGSYVDGLKSRVAGHETGVQSPPRKRARTATEHEPSPQGGDASHLQNATGATEPNPDGAGSSDEQTSGSEDAAVRDTMGAIGFLSNSAMAETRKSLDEAAPHRLALADLVLSALAVSGHDPSTSHASHSGIILDEHQIPLEKEASTQHYARFMSWSFFLPYLDCGRMQEHFEETITYHNGPRTGSPPQLLHRFNAYLMIATGMMMSHDASQLSLLAASLHSAAVKMIPHIFRDHGPLGSLHCMAMLISFSLFSSSGGSAWHLVGIAVKSCITLGLHKDAPSQLNADLGVDYEPRWLFWTLYNFDRCVFPHPNELCSNSCAVFCVLSWTDRLEFGTGTCPCR